MGPTGFEPTTHGLKNHHRKNQLEEKIKCGKDYRDYDLVTASLTGNYVLPSNLNRSYWLAMDRSKVKRHHVPRFKAQTHYIDAYTRVLLK